MLRAEGGWRIKGLDLTLHPYQATVIVLTDKATGPRRDPAPLEPAGGCRPNGGGWRSEASRPQPVEFPHVWEEDPTRRHYSGSATYETEVELARPADRRE